VVLRQKAVGRKPLTSNGETTLNTFEHREYKKHADQT